MEQKNLAKWLKVIIAGMALCGLALAAYFAPSMAQDIVDAYPEFANCAAPWLILVWLTALPCFAMLFLGWRVADRIGKDRTFTAENALDLKRVSRLAAADSLLLILGNLILFFLNMNHPGVVLMCFFAAFVGIAFAVVTAILSNMVKKGTDLQEQSDLTI